jgi:hypothetical protein
MPISRLYNRPKAEFFRHEFSALVLLVFIFSINSTKAQVPVAGIKAGAGVHPVLLNSLRGNGMAFTENKGQVVDMDKNLRPDVLFQGAGGGTDVYLRKTGISYVLNNMGDEMHEVDEAAEKFEKAMTKEQFNNYKLTLIKKMEVKLHRVDIDFIGAAANPETIAVDPIDGYNNYYYGHCPQGITQVYSYNQITAKNIYKNIDVKYYGGKEKGLKYDIIVNPGGDPNEIKLRYSGVDGIEIKNGELKIKNSIGEMSEKMPKVYQTINGEIVEVKAEYKLERERDNTVIIHFSFSAFNSSFPLVIDPWATYYSGGGAGFTIGTGSGVAADAVGNVIVTGHAATQDFPVSPGAFQMTPGSASGYMDAFIVKFNVSGTRIFGTYFGGNKSDEGYGITTDGNDDILISGMTTSTNFPTKNPAGGAYFQSGLSGGTNADAFVAKFTPAGLLTWSTLYGGSGIENGNDVITDGANNVILVGATGSNNLPIQAAYQGALNGTQDAFIVKFNSGCVRQWATYYGGTGNDDAMGVACDTGNNIFFTGTTSSTDIPLVAAFQGAAGGGGDAFAVKLNGATGFPLWSTYYGGSGAEWGIGVVVDIPGNCIIVGGTSSANNIASAGANQIAFAGGQDAFVAKFSPVGARLWGTFHGGVNAEGTGGCAVDSKNNIYWYGEVEDAQPNPTWISTCAYQNTYNGAEDQLISKFDPNGKLLCTTAIGGPGEEDFDGGSVAPHFDIAVHDPFIYISAHVRGGGYPVSAGAFQTINRTPGNGENDAFINQLCMNICQQQFLGTTATASQTIICPNVPISFTSSVNNACDTTGLRFAWTFTGATPNTSTNPNPTISYAVPGFYSVKLVVTTPCQKDSVVKTNYIIVNPCTMNAAAVGATICSNTCANITASGSSGTNPYTYSWSTGGTTATISVCPATTTDYTVMVTDATGKYAATTTTVIVHPPLTTNTSSTNISCTTSGNAIVTVSSGAPSFTYNWSNGFLTGPTSQTGSSSNNGLAAGGYTVTVTDGNGCIITKTFNITGSSPVSATFTSSSLCVGTQVNFTNTGTPPGTGITYNWVISPITPTNVSGTTTDFSYTFLTPGTYSVQHTVGDGTCTNTITQNITVINCTAGPTATATSSAVCPGSCATVTSTGSGGTGAYTYSWSTGATSKNINSCPASTTTYTVKITDAGGVTATATATVTINPAISITATPILNCGTNSGSVTATTTGGSTNYTYSWSNGVTTITGSLTSQISSLTSNTYSVTVTDSKGCSASSSAIIDPPFSAQYIKGTAPCSGCGCKEWIMVTPSNGRTPYTYSWPDGYDKRYLNRLCPGTYTISVTDKNGCNVNVSVNTP